MNIKRASSPPKQIFFHHTKQPEKKRTTTMSVKYVNVKRSGGLTNDTIAKLGEKLGTIVISNENDLLFQTTNETESHFTTNGLDFLQIPFESTKEFKLTVAPSATYVLKPKETKSGIPKISFVDYEPKGSRELLESADQSFGDCSCVVVKSIPESKVGSVVKIIKSKLDGSFVHIEGSAFGIAKKEDVHYKFVHAIFYDPKEFKAKLFAEPEGFDYGPSIFYLNPIKSKIESSFMICCASLPPMSRIKDHKIQATQLPLAHISRAVAGDIPFFDGHKSFLETNTIHIFFETSEFLQRILTENYQCETISKSHGIHYRSQLRLGLNFGHHSNGFFEVSFEEQERQEQEKK